MDLIALALSSSPPLKLPPLDSIHSRSSTLQSKSALLTEMLEILNKVTDMVGDIECIREGVGGIPKVIEGLREDAEQVSKGLKKKKGREERVG